MPSMDVRQRAEEITIPQTNNRGPSPTPRKNTNLIIRRGIGVVIMIALPFIIWIALVSTGFAGAMGQSLQSLGQFITDTWNSITGAQK